MSDQFLSIDAGTQSLRVLIFDGEGNQIARERVTYTPYLSARPGWAEQDPESFWDALKQACGRLWRNPKVRKDALASVAVTTQRGSVINLDKYHQPLRNAILWLDARTTSGEKPIGGLWGFLFKVAGVSHTIAGLQANAESNWLRAHQPEVWKKTERFLFISGFLNHRLTGRYADSVACQVGYVPFDYKKLRWAGPKDWKWQALGVEPHMLPELLPPGEVIGPVSGPASLATGIPEGLPVIAAAADKACEVLGSGSLEPEVGCISYGTTATYNITSRRYLEAIPFIPPYPAAVPHAYSMEIQIFRGYWMVEWFKRQFCDEERAGAQSIEHQLDVRIREIPPGSQGLMMQPYWTPGVKLPGPEARGSFIGFTDVHTKAHMYRAVLEGIAFAMREGKERVTRKCGVPTTNLRVSGGGSQSDSAMQLTADIFGLPAARPHTFETSGLGAAIIQAVGMGMYPDFASAQAAMCHTGEVFEPAPDAQRTYDELYQQVYLKLYKRLKPLYQHLFRMKI